MVKSEAEFEEKLGQVGRLYRAIRVEFAKVTLTQDTAAPLLKATSLLVDRITSVLGEIEEYSGAADTRRLVQAMNEVRDQRAKEAAEKNR